MSNVVNLVSAVYLNGICQLGSICAWYGDIPALTNSAEKLGRLKCQISLPKEEKCSQHGQCSAYSNSTDTPHHCFQKNSLGTRIGYDFQPASQLAHKSQNEGLISTDRSSKSTAYNTPFHSKSSTKDLSQGMVQFDCRGQPPGSSPFTRTPRS